MLLCGSLDGSDLLVGDHLTSVIIGDMPEITFSDEEACIWCNRVYVVSELVQSISLHNLGSHSRGHAPFPKYPVHWGHLMMP